MIRFCDRSNWSFPNIRWAFSHQRELVPTVAVWRGIGSPAPLPVALRDDLDDIAFHSLDGQRLTWRGSLEAACTDGILLLHQGRVIYERYCGALAAHRPHLAMSVTKSVVGLIAGLLVEQHRLDPSLPVADLLPELAGSAFAAATLRQVMDMTVAVRYSEDYTNPAAEFWGYAAAANFIARAPGESGPGSIHAFLAQLRPHGAHGQAFAYKTCNTEVLAWAISRLTGQSIATLVSELLWQKLGAEEDGYFIVDADGTPMAGGGLNVTLRDLARLGEMLRLDGRFNGQQILPPAVIADIRRGADPAQFAMAGYAALAGWSYRTQWWVCHDAWGAFTARGIHGQALWIAPKAELVIARFASHPTAANGNGPLDNLSLPAYRALARHLASSP
jgi:CubicO group peptidase (beta-lactamase class C family)